MFKFLLFVVLVFALFAAFVAHYVPPLALGHIFFFRDPVFMMNATRSMSRRQGVRVETTSPKQCGAIYGKDKEATPLILIVRQAPDEDGLPRPMLATISAPNRKRARDRYIHMRTTKSDLNEPKAKPYPGL
jgi:hypothetical protein